MITLINKSTNSKIIVPEISNGERYYMIDNKYLGIKYVIGSIYLDKNEWNLIN